MLWLQYFNELHYDIFIHEYKRISILFTSPVTLFHLFLFLLISLLFPSQLPSIFFFW